MTILRASRICAAAAAAVVAAIAAAGCYDRFDPPHTDGSHSEHPAANCTIADLVAMYRGSTVVIDENMIIEGRVTSSDRAGNFYRMFTVEQGGAAVGIMAGLTDLHNVWPVGSIVSVRLQGLALGESEGVKCIGLPPAPYDYQPVGTILSRRQLDSRIVRLHDPQPFGIPSFSAAMLDRSMCGRLLHVVPLSRMDDTNGATWGGCHIFVDSDDFTAVAVVVSDYADFASHAINLPTDRSFAVTGILFYGRPDGADKDMFIIKPRDENDILY